MRQRIGVAGVLHHRGIIRQQTARPLGQTAARFGRSKAPRRALEQPAAKPRFQPCQDPADRWRGTA